jgi:hypothetical protein
LGNNNITMNHKKVIAQEPFFLLVQSNSHHETQWLKM